jgi:7,8-dihydropterin-6-yl-methyl-4-(beta-D-ribofuranosyl)aminobenzene 5'-phosphate synthase
MAMRRMVLAFAALVLGLAAGTAGSAPPAPVRSLRITTLSTMLADTGIGEWGFAALVEVDGRRILFDTGARPRTVLENARELKVELTGITDVVLSHNHGDHTGGLLTLRRDVMARDRAGLARAHVGRGAFWSRPSTDGSGERNALLRSRAEYEAAGGAFVEHDRPRELQPGVWLTGPVPRVNPERNYPRDIGKVLTPEGLVDDTVPEDLSLVFDTERGLVILTGCGHAGVVNVMEHARATVRDAPVHAIVGGLHLFELDDERLAWTAAKLKANGLQNLLGAHCTGLEAVYRIREQAGLPRRACVVGAVGSVLDLQKGIDPLDLAR